MRQGLVGLALRHSLEVRSFVVVVPRRLCLFDERGNGGGGVDGGAME